MRNANRKPWHLEWKLGGQATAMTAVLGLSILGFAILNPILPLYLTSIGNPPHIMGLVMSAIWLGMVLGEIGGGWIADRIGLRVPLIVGTIVSAPVVLSFVLARSVAGILIVSLVWGTVRGAVFGPGRGYIGTIAPAEKRATVMAVVVTVIAASRSVGSLPSGFITEYLGYDWAFCISAGISVLAGILVVTRLRGAHLRRTEHHAASPFSSVDHSGTFLLLTYRPFLLQGILAALSFAGTGTISTFVPLLATQVVGVRAGLVGVLITIQTSTAMVLSIPMGIWADRLGKRAFMTLGFLLSASSLAGMAYAPSYAWLVVFALVSGLGSAMVIPAAWGQLSESVPLHLQSTAMGVYGAFEDVGVIVASSLGGILWSVWGPQATFLWGALLVGGGAIICLSHAGAQISEPLRVKG